ncbi:hypothetical protein RHMOL_Rhmol01G0337900 [Rhododendron molle]|uniref:Uncharacterized protein n=1 Tax=Rhododendron molle TaxID=49168 RepID=A0ACC0Q9V2_RHOML|nr:hypothetical protein RHMOL_Rhmol01G0337900 [Rhododendron molle]
MKTFSSVWFYDLSNKWKRHCSGLESGSASLSRPAGPVWEMPCQARQPMPIDDHMGHPAQGYCGRAEVSGRILKDCIRIGRDTSTLSCPTQPRGTAIGPATWLGHLLGTRQ